MTGALGVLGTVVVDCDDPAELAAFWSEVLGRPIASAEAGWAELETSDGVPALAFQKVEPHRRPRWPSRRTPQQMHLDIRVTDLESSVAAAVGLGARLLSDVQDPGGTPWRVLEDPAGHPFCFVTG